MAGDRIPTKADVGNRGVGDVIWDQGNHHDKEKSQTQAPVEVSGARLEEAGNLKDYQLEHGQGEGEGEREDELHQDVPDLVVPEELPHEENPSSDKENYLQGREEW